MDVLIYLGGIGTGLIVSVILTGLIGRFVFTNPRFQKRIGQIVIRKLFAMPPVFDWQYNPADGKMSIPFIHLPRNGE